MINKDRCYFRGKWFYTPEEMFDFISKWKPEPLDERNAEFILDGLKKDIITNVFVRGNGFDNDGFQRYINEVFAFAMKRLGEKE
jgi:hypothetical protein